MTQINSTSQYKAKREVNGSSGRLGGCCICDVYLILESSSHTTIEKNQLKSMCHSLHEYILMWLVLTFSLVLSSSNISWISTRQSSCMLWKESWGMVAITASSIADSCSRMQEKEGRTCGSWSQHSGQTHCKV